MIILPVLIFTMFSSLYINNVYAFSKPNYNPLSWPGRPKNPDGTGIDTDTFTCRGVWVYQNSHTRRAEDIRRKKEGEVENLMSALNIFTFFGFSALSYMSLIPKYTSNIKRDLYTAKSYISDNCIRIDYEFIDYYSTEVVDRRTEYSKFRK